MTRALQQTSMHLNFSSRTLALCTTHLAVPKYRACIPAADVGTAAAWTAKASLDLWQWCWWWWWWCCWDARDEEGGVENLRGRSLGSRRLCLDTLDSLRSGGSAVLHKLRAASVVWAAISVRSSQLADFKQPSSCLQYCCLHCSMSVFSKLILVEKLHCYLHETVK
jgi:hypothetical protein